MVANAAGLGPGRRSVLAVGELQVTAPKVYLACLSTQEATLLPTWPAAGPEGLSGCYSMKAVC